MKDLFRCNASVKRKHEDCELSEQLLPYYLAGSTSYSIQSRDILYGVYIHVSLLLQLRITSKLFEDFGGSHRLRNRVTIP